MNIKKKISFFNTLLNNSKKYQYLLEDSIGLSNLRPFLDNHPYIPITEKTLRPFILNFIINEILINNRNTIVEFGAGISTILIGRVLKMQIPNGTLCSVEHDEGWYNYLKEKLIQENLTNQVDLVFAPLVINEGDELKMPWYDKKVLNNKLKSIKEVDLVVVDGPPAYEEINLYSRMSALPFLISKLNERFCIIIDDASRKGEKYAIKEWQKNYNILFSIYSDSMAVAYAGDHFISTPL